MTIFSLRRHSRGLGLSPRRRKAEGAASPSIVQDGLIAEWRFDDGAGQQVTDYSGNGFHLTLGATGGAGSDDPTWTERGLTFDDVNDIATSAASYNHPDDTSMHITLVFNTATGADSFDRLMVVGFVGTGATDNTAEIALGGGGAVQKLRYRVSRREPLTVNDADGTGTHALDSWHTVQVNISSEGTQFQLLGYVDGALDRDSGIFNDSFFDGKNGPFRFGALAAGSAHYKGQIAYALVYDRLLSAEEMTQNRAALAAILAPRGITLP